MSTVLFGFDLVAIFMAVLKLATELLGLSAKATRYVGAFLVSVAVVIVGLQEQGVILGPETEATVVLALNAVTAFLVALGFGPEVVGTVTALLDLPRLKAMMVYKAMQEERGVAPNVLKKLLGKSIRRYGLF